MHRQPFDLPAMELFHLIDSLLELLFILVGYFVDLAVDEGLVTLLELLTNPLKLLPVRHLSLFKFIPPFRLETTCSFRLLK